MEVRPNFAAPALGKTHEKFPEPCLFGNVICDQERRADVPLEKDLVQEFEGRHIGRRRVEGVIFPLEKPLLLDIDRDHQFHVRIASIPACIVMLKSCHEVASFRLQ